LVMGAGAEFCLAQNSSSDPLPPALQKGINISDVYGNY